MFLTEKQRLVVPLFPAPSRQEHQQQLSALVSQSHAFDAALSSRLLSLLPIPIPKSPANSIKTSCTWLSRASHLLSLTLADALKLHSSTITTPSLDSATLALLHSCNALSALSHSLLRRLLFLRFRFSLPSHNPTLIFPQKKPLPLPEMTPPRLHPPPHGKIDPAQNAIYALEVVSALVIRAIRVTLSGEGAEHLKHLNSIDEKVFPWGKEFNELLEAVVKRIREEEDDRGCGGAGSVDAQLAKMEAVVVIGEGGMERSGVEEMEAKCEEMREGLETLEAAVNEIFQAALSARNAALPPNILNYCN